MDYKTLIDWHCSGNKLDIEDLEILDSEFNECMKGSNTSYYFDIAPPHICNSCMIAENSLWISCLASVLDQLKPIEKANQRTKKLFNFLCRKRLIVTD